MRLMKVDTVFDLKSYIVLGGTPEQEVRVGMPIEIRCGSDLIASTTIEDIKHYKDSFEIFPPGKACGVKIPMNETLLLSQTGLELHERTKHEPA